MQITPNTVDRAKTLIKRYFDDKGFKNAEVIIAQKDDPSSENQVIVDIDIDKKGENQSTRNHHCRKHCNQGFQAEKSNEENQ